jgi:hypothetical protein
VRQPGVVRDLYDLAVEADDADQHVFGWNRDAYGFTIGDRDEAGARARSELTSRAVNETANSLAQSADHIKRFFKLLGAELGFYLGCLNLRDRLLALGLPGLLPRCRRHAKRPVRRPRPLRRQPRAHPG